jgi:hypothetical protein
VLKLPDSGDGPPDAWVSHGDGYVSITTVANWARAQGALHGPLKRQVVVANVESGPYELCAGPSVLAALATDRHPPDSACVSGELLPGGELTLELKSAN